MTTVGEAKQRLDLIIRKSRVHLYKPIQLAEILHQHRVFPSFDLEDLGAYRSKSKHWRDQVSNVLVGRVSTSSARFQDNLFEANAMPPKYLAILGRANEASGSEGVVEAYIYACLKIRLTTLGKLSAYLAKATPETFDLRAFLAGFVMAPGLRRSADKAYEIVVYALFDTLVQGLQAKVSVEVPVSQRELLAEFESFARIVLGVTLEQPRLETPARLHRVGVANAADRGLDMWSNFGPAVQVKHVSLSEDMMGEIADEVSDHAKIVIVCREGDRCTIERVVSGIGLAGRIQGVITMADLEGWYAKCFSAKHAGALGRSLLSALKTEFDVEFPSTGTVLSDFCRERGYDKISLEGVWAAIA